MVTKDPFKPLILILVTFAVIYGLYSIFYKRRYSFFMGDSAEYNASVTYYDDEYEDDVDNQEETKSRSKRSSSQEVLDESTSPLLILVLASNARSGSTLLAELLSTTGESVHFFEPLRLYKDKPELFNNMTISRYLAKILRCSLNEEFQTLLRETYPFNEYFHSSIVRCLSDRAPLECLEKLQPKRICKQAKVRIAKVVRARLSDVKPLLRSPSTPNVKVIHLTRDPRGSITSMQSLFWLWKPSLKCADLWDDMQTYDRLVKKFPESLIQVTHEELSLNPTKTMAKLNRFLNGQSDISSVTHQYIKTHMNSTRYQEDPLSTYSASRDKYQSWRWKINGRLLSEIENDPSCRQTIEKYGHNLFGSLDRVTDPRIPLEKSDEGLSDEILQMYSQ